MHRSSPILYCSASSLPSSYVSLVPKWLIQITSRQNMTWQILNLLDSSPLDSIWVNDSLVPSCCSVMLRCDSMWPLLIFLPPPLSSARSAAVKSQHILWWSFSFRPIIKPTQHSFLIFHCLHLLFSSLQTLHFFFSLLALYKSILRHIALPCSAHLFLSCSVSSCNPLSSTSLNVTHSSI